VGPSQGDKQAQKTGLEYPLGDPAGREGSKVSIDTETGKTFVMFILVLILALSGMFLAWRIGVQVGYRKGLNARMVKLRKQGLRIVGKKIISNNARWN
jgi:hypothetical protein